jgi:hypothetical protein
MPVSRQGLSIPSVVYDDKICENDNGKTTRTLVHGLKINMMKTTLFYSTIVFLILGIAACSKDDEGPDKPDNRPPEAFNLVEVANNATGVPIMPAFNWQAATDPDGDAVTYGIYLDTETDPTTELAAGLSQTSYTITDRLHLNTPYNWKVVARDDKNSQTESAATFTFTTRNLSKGTEATPDAGFSTRFRHSSVMYDGKIWVLGGYNGTRKKDVWYSSDGTNWEEAPQTLSHFSARDGHSSVVYDGKIWVLGGHDGTRSEDVWYSSDGINWTKTDPDDNFTARTAHSSVVFDNKIWVIGGHDGTNRKNDVWYSTDGTTNWEEATADAGFSARMFHTSVVFDNKIWVIGGEGEDYGISDIWYSSDGTNWTEATPAAGFSARAQHSSVVYDGKIWVIGGVDKDSEKNDVWYSSDGTNWEAQPMADFPGRRGHTSVVYDDKIWVMGGRNDNDYANDVWYLD